MSNASVVPFDGSDPLRAKLLSLRVALESQIRGQGHVIEPVLRVLQRGEMGLTNAKRPRGSFLMVGPSGVGKTETTLVFTNHLFGGDGLVRFDMSEFTLHESVSVMIGNAGNPDGGRMGKAMAGKKNCTVLFDEIEKGHPLVLDLMLQILDAGRLTLANDTTIDFTGCYIVLTSNIGARDAMQMRKTGLTGFEKAVLTKFKQDPRIRPEFFFRVNSKLVFRALEIETQETIADDMIRLSLARMAKLGYMLTMSPAGRSLVIELGIDRESGARPLRGVSEDFIEGAIAEAALEGKPTSGLLVPNEQRTHLVIQPNQ